MTVKRPRNYCWFSEHGYIECSFISLSRAVQPTNDTSLGLMSEQNNINTQMKIYNSILPIRIRINNNQNKFDRWYPPTEP